LIDPLPQVFVADAAGTHVFDGRNWSPLTNASLTRVPITMDLGEGLVSAEILEVRLDGVPTHFGAWQTGNFTPSDLANPAISGENAAPFGDRIPNLLRYALGATGSEAVNLPQFGKAAGAATFRFRYDPALFDIVYQVEATHDLTDWSHPLVLFDSSISTLQPAADGWLTITDPAPPVGRSFYRLKVVRLTN
jgi:hypothetical protein